MSMPMTMCRTTISFGTLELEFIFAIACWVRSFPPAAAYTLTHVCGPNVGVPNRRPGTHNSAINLGARTIGKPKAAVVRACVRVQII